MEPDWTYDQSSGQVFFQGKLYTQAYSGRDAGKNNPALQDKVALGPIPRGIWRMGNPYKSEAVGRYCIPLIPMEGTVTFNRTAFLIHGDSVSHPGKASKGCIIVSPLSRRQTMYTQGNRLVRVIE